MKLSLRAGLVAGGVLVAVVAVALVMREPIDRQSSVATAWEDRVAEVLVGLPVDLGGYAESQPWATTTIAESEGALIALSQALLTEQEASFHEFAEECRAAESAAWYPPAVARIGVACGVLDAALLVDLSRLGTVETLSLLVDSVCDGSAFTEPDWVAKQKVRRDLRQIRRRLERVAHVSACAR